MLYEVTHRTAYSYTSEVTLSHHLAHLQPRTLRHQELLDFHLEISPEPQSIHHRINFHETPTSFFSIVQPHTQLIVTARSQVRVVSPILPTSSPPWESVRLACSGSLLTDATTTGEFRFDSPYVTRNPDYADYAATAFPPGQPLLDGLRNLTAQIHRDFRFDPLATTVATPLADFFQNRRGVCQDFAHFGIACLRSLGLPARYVSGYLETLPPPGKTRLVGADASHAWISAWSPDFGWIDADPTNHLFPEDRHITVAWGRDFSDVSPLRGVVIGGGEHQMTVAVDVAPLSA